MTRVGGYERISEDANDDRLGVERQARDNVTQANLLGWDLVEHYVDNDVSAFKKTVVRKNFERLLSDLTSGALDGVVVYNLDRLCRQPRDLERLIDIYESRPELVFASVGGDINLQLPDGQTMARVMVAFANKSSKDTGRRTARKHLELAEAGIPVGGRRPFGWQDDKVTLSLNEADLVRTAVQEMIDGKALTRVCREWNSAGVSTTSGGPWSPQTLRNYMRNPRLVGVRTHQRKVLLDSEGHPVRGIWEPMLHPDTFERLQLVVGPQGVEATGRRGARKYMLTGLLRCGVCRRQMHGTNAAEEGRFNYVCNNNAADGTARHTVSVSGHPVEKVVGALIVDYLSNEHLESTQVEAWSGEERLTQVTTQIDELMAAFSAGQLSGAVVFPRVEALEQEQARILQGRSQWLLETQGPALQRVTVEEWQHKDDYEKRAIIDKVLSSIYVRPVTRRAAGFDPERLVPVWRADRRSPGADPG